MLACEALDEAALLAAATALGRILRPGDVILLDGPMGAGKTTFVRALAAGLGVDRPDRVCSPTFAVALHHAGPVALDHVDLCRLGELGDGAAPGAAFEALGLDELGEAYERGTAGGVLVVEWAGLWADPPPDHIAISITVNDDPTRRDLVVRGLGPRAAACVRAWQADPAMIAATTATAGTPPAGPAQPAN